MTSPCCRLASHPAAHAIEAALRQGDSVRDVAEAFSVPKSTVAAHRGHLGISGSAKPANGQPEGNALDGDQEVSKVSREVTRGEASESHSDTSNSRARDPMPLRQTEAFGILHERERVRYITNALASGHEWDSNRDVPLLADAWGVSEGTVRNYLRRARDVMTENLGDVEQARLESRAWWRHLRDEAEAAAGQSPPDDVPVPVAAAIVSNAPKFLSVAVDAQKSLDRVTGVVQPGVNVVVQLLQNPLVGQMLTVVRERLEPYPEALAAVAEGLEQLKAQHAGVSGAKLLKGGT